MRAKKGLGLISTEFGSLHSLLSQSPSSFPLPIRLSCHEFSAFLLLFEQTSTARRRNLWPIVRAAPTPPVPTTLSLNIKFPPPSPITSIQRRYRELVSSSPPNSGSFVPMIINDRQGRECKGTYLRRLGAAPPPTRRRRLHSRPGTRTSCCLEQASQARSAAKLRSRSCAPDTVTEILKRRRLN